MRNISSRHFGLCQVYLGAEQTEFFPFRLCLRKSIELHLSHKHYTVDWFREGAPEYFFQRKLDIPSCSRYGKEDCHI